MIRESPAETFSDIYHEVSHIYDLFKFEEKGKCEIHKDCQDCKQAVREMHIKDTLVLPVWITI